jgi:PilZ domain
MTDRRAVARQRTFLGGRLMYNNGNSSEDCVVRNLSDRGAQIESPHPLAPSALDLLVSARNLVRSARVTWRSGGRFGLEFEGDARPLSAAANSARPHPDDNRY